MPDETTDEDDEPRNSKSFPKSPEVTDDIWIRIFMIGVFLGKIAEIFLPGYFYYLGVPSIISMIKNDDNILSKIREVTRLIR